MEKETPYEFSEVKVKLFKAINLLEQQHDDSKRIWNDLISSNYREIQKYGLLYQEFSNKMNQDIPRMIRTIYYVVNNMNLENINHISDKETKKVLGSEYKEKHELYGDFKLISLNIRLRNISDIEQKSQILESYLNVNQMYANGLELPVTLKINESNGIDLSDVVNLAPKKEISFNMIFLILKDYLKSDTWINLKTENLYLTIELYPKKA